MFSRYAAGKMARKQTAGELPTELRTKPYVMTTLDSVQDAGQSLFDGREVGGLRALALPKLRKTRRLIHPAIPLPGLRRQNQLAQWNDEELLSVRTGLLQFVE